MVLADLGADVIRVDRIEGAKTPIGTSGFDVLNRGKRSIGLDLKKESSVAVALELIAASEVLIEGFRPGVVERLGLGPEVCHGRNPRLVYGRVTGWGQDGPMASMAGHDIDYIALSGALGAIGTTGEPVPPLNLVGDFGGGGMLLAVGVLSALVHARDTGLGQVVDAAMVDGSALLTASHHGYMAEGWWTPARGSNLLDGAAPFYTTYRTADDLHVAVGALEPQFFSELLELLELCPADVPDQHDRERWPEMRSVFADRFATKTRDQWADAAAGTDACVAPVLSLGEAPTHPHNRVRGTFVEIGGVVQPGPAPRFSRTPTAEPGLPVTPGSATDDILTSLGFSRDRIVMLRRSGAIG
jgi:alpha-methylacyl-CoA racemase